MNAPQRQSRNERPPRSRTTSASHKRSHASCPGNQQRSPHHAATMQIMLQMRCKIDVLHAPARGDPAPYAVHSATVQARSGLPFHVSCPTRHTSKPWAMPTHMGHAHSNQGAAVSARAARFCGRDLLTHAAETNGDMQSSSDSSIRIELNSKKNESCEHDIAGPLSIASPQLTSVKSAAKPAERGVHPALCYSARQ